MRKLRKERGRMENIMKKMDEEREVRVLGNMKDKINEKEILKMGRKKKIEKNIEGRKRDRRIMEK